MGITVFMHFLDTFPFKHSYMCFFETSYHCVAQAGLEPLGSSNPPASASRVSTLQAFDTSPG
jgi:hypothetical protein